jgi:hypothetical protein
MKLDLMNRSESYFLMIEGRLDLTYGTYMGKG